MAEHGGYRKPANPAPVSGPGALSRRTDGAQPQMPVTGLPYGENSELASIQAAAPLAQASGSGGTPAPSQPAGDPFAGLTGMGAASARPGEDVMTGVGAPGVPQSQQELMSADAAQLARMLPVLIRQAQMPDATPSFRRYVRLLVANQPRSS